MPGGLINILSFDVPIIFISFYFGNTYLGLFSLAHRVITLPTILLAKSVGDVYRKLIFDFKVEEKIMLPIFLKFLKNNLLLSILPCILIYLFIEEIITIVFGQNWIVAGQYSKILIFYAFFQFVITPLDKGAIILNHTRYYFNWTLFFQFIKQSFYGRLRLNFTRFHIFNFFNSNLLLESIFITFFYYTSIMVP